MDCQYASSAVSFGAASSGRIMADRVGEGGFGMRLCCTMKALTITYRLRRIWGTGEAITSLRFGGGGYPQPAITPSAGLPPAIRGGLSGSRPRLQAVLCERAAEVPHGAADLEIGSASCRERVCQSV